MQVEPEPRAAELERLAGDLEADLEAMDQLAADCQAQRDALVADPSDRGAASIMALGMHGYYTAVESALERVERLLVAPPAPGPTWHQDLLWGATRPIGDARPAVITAETARPLDRLRGFRHFLRHAYMVELEASELLRTVASLDAVHLRLQGELRDFIAFLRQIAAELRQQA